MLQKSKEATSGWKPERLLERNAFLCAVFVLASCTAFALGRLSVMEESRSPVKIIFPESRETLSADFPPSVSSAEPAFLPGISSSSDRSSKRAESGGNFAGTGDESSASSLKTDKAEGQYVASKNGTKYHLPWCSGAKRIGEANKIWFATKEAAEKAGYTPAANCRGI